jgi:hypothetical protein
MVELLPAMIDDGYRANFSVDCAKKGNKEEE